MKFYFPFVTLLVSVAAQSTIVDDLNERVSPQVTKLANDVQGFPASGLDGALGIDLDSKDLATVLDSATQNARNTGPFSQTDGVTIIADLTPIINTFTDLLNGLSAKKDDFNVLVLSAGPLILSDLQKLNQSVVGYSDALIEDAPITQVPAYVAIKNTLAGAFAQTIADYES
ncbi:hypothetical protein N7523_007500 [Penicillium sp. IBT 18751x]|nr:hypothetical protein N7523_007500 [Penicillium sp. IBT 18751x]